MTIGLRGRLGAVLAAFLLVVSSGAGVGAVTGNSDGPAPVEVTACTTISESGHYVLGTDLLNVTATQDTGIVTEGGNATACVLITSSDVVFDGAGHVVDGVTDPEGPLFPSGVAAVALGDDTITNVTISNVTATDWFIGVLTSNVVDSTVRDSVATNNDNIGFELLGNATATRLLVANNVADRNAFAGIYLAGGNDNRVENNTAADNGVFGIELFASDGNTVLGSVTERNAVGGIAVVDSADTLLLDNSVVDTAGDDAVFGLSGGLVVYNSTTTRVVGLEAVGNEGWDVYATLGSHVRATDVTLDSATVAFIGVDVALDAVAPGDVPEAPSGETLVGPAVEVANTTENGTLDLAIYYDETGLGDAEATLHLWTYDAGDDRWTRVSGGPGVNPVTNSVTGTVPLDGIVVVAPLVSVRDT